MNLRLPRDCKEVAEGQKLVTKIYYKIVTRKLRLLLIVPLKHRSTSLLMLLGIHLDVADMLIPSLILVPLTHNLIPAKLRPHPSPSEPIHDSKEQDAHTDNGEDEVRVAFCIPVTIRRDERHDSEEDVGQEVKYGHGEICVPWRCPGFALGVVQIDEAGGDKTVDPGTGVGVQVGDEVVCWASGRGNEDDDRNQPVQE